MGYKIKRILVGTNQVRPSIPDYLCFTANTANSTVQLTKVGSPTAVNLEISPDGNSRFTYYFGDTMTLSNIGQKVYFRNTSETDTGFSTYEGGSNYYKFVMSGSISGSGDVTYLLNKNGTTTLSDYCFVKLFDGCSSLTTAPDLPATTLGSRSCMLMFSNCSSLTTSPKIRATTLGTYCFYNMFSLCTSLETLPALPATTLPDSCYYLMFGWCSKIKLSTTQTGEYQTPYRIPTTGTGSVGTDSLGDMFNSTGGTFTGTPTINTTYYTSNTVV